MIILEQNALISNFKLLCWEYLLEYKKITKGIIVICTASALTWMSLAQLDFNLPTSQKVQKVPSKVEFLVHFVPSKVEFLVHFAMHMTHAHAHDA